MMRFIVASLVMLAFGGLSFAQEAKIGQKAPDFTLTDSQGKQHSLADYQGKIVVLEWINPECPFVQRHYKEKTMVNAAEEFASKDVVWLAINSTAHATPDQMNKWIAEHSIKYPILMDNSGEVGKKYGAKTTPHMYIIDKEGTLVYQGGIDNDPSGNKADRVNYVNKALAEVTAGESVSQAESRPYGCSVKYKN